MAERFPVVFGTQRGADLTGRWCGARDIYTFDLRHDGDGYSGSHRFQSCLVDTTIAVRASRAGEELIVEADGDELRLTIAEVCGETVLLYPHARDELQSGEMIDPEVVPDWRSDPMILRKVQR